MTGFYVSETEISERADLLADIAKGLFTDGIFSSDRIVLREARIPYLARGYFLLNKAYKQWRISDGHYTELPKIAALQAATIIRFQPFRLLHIGSAGNIAEARCNEIFACAYALGILECAFTPDTPIKRDFWLRLLDILSAADIETLEPYVVDINMTCVRPLDEYTLVIHKDDKLIINSLISIFELISDKGRQFWK
ncbi:MAG: hypothetical protein WAL39_03155 [Xanthobacteraceae bacterium]